ncbi:MAG TPA: cupin domain-containing protein [Candidatus Limnocylindrales bacterium]|jgi:quercetin dioxygenase-like cupin family protein|nr:cupin domain-containing protein [Candidatus Limnocylindrales bacterium]
MARLFKRGEAKELGLPGRRAMEIVSGEFGAREVTLRLVEIPVAKPGDELRAAHHHSEFEECIYTLSGQGTTFADSGEYAMRPGDTLLMPPGEKHVTRNTGSEPLVLLCFFPVADIAAATQEPGISPRTPKKP